MGESYNIIIVGCGGTGGNFIKELGRFLYKNPIQNQCNILLIDGDIVEEKNIARQPFLPRDIGRKKSEVMCEILQECFDIFCFYSTEYIDTISDIQQWISPECVTILIGCVDNHECRIIMHQLFQQLETCIYLDSANEYSVGELVVGVKMGGILFSPDRTYYYPEILTETHVSRSEESCIDENIQKPQHFVTNLFAANLLLMVTVELISGKAWSGGIYYFDALKGYSSFRAIE